MSNILQAKKLWYNGEIVTDGCDASINCEQLTGATPRNGWIQPEGGCCGNEAYGLTLERPADMTGVLQGTWIETADGRGMLLDALLEDVIDGCNACCGTVAPIPPVYDGNIPEVPDPVAGTYTFTRTDDGNYLASYRAQMDYFGQYVNGTFFRTGYTNGVSTYTFQAYADPVWRDGDTPGTPPTRVFISNVAPTLTPPNVYTLTVLNKGIPITPVLHGVDVAALIVGANLNAEYSVLGTYAAEGSTQIKLTSDVTPMAQLIIGQGPMPPPLEDENPETPEPAATAKKRNTSKQSKK